MALAAAAVAWLCIRSAERSPASDTGSHARVASWLACCAALGLRPVVAGNFVVTYANAYPAFPAVPWCAMLIGLAFSRAPARIIRVAVPAVVFWNTLSLTAAPPRLESPSAWQAPFSTWRDALRFAAVTERISADLRTPLTFDFDSLDLRRVDWNQNEALHLAGNAIVAGRGQRIPLLQALEAERLGLTPSSPVTP